MIGIGERCLEDRIEQQDSIVVASQAKTVAIPEKDLVMLGQIFAFNDFIVGIYGQRKRGKLKVVQRIAGIVR